MSNLLAKLDKFLDKTGRKRIIYDRKSKEPYLLRYYIFLKDRKKFPFNAFIHKFLCSDFPTPHDHPWPFFSLILKGGYWEWLPIYNELNEIIGEDRVWRGRFTFRFAKATDYHRIELEPGVDCWTLFMPGPQKREWGFLTHRNWNKESQVWVQHEEYIAGNIK